MFKNIQAYLGYIAGLFTDHSNKADIAIKWVTGTFFAFSACKSYVDTLLKSIKCAIALYVKKKKQCLYVNLKIRYCLKMPKE